MNVATAARPTVNRRRLVLGAVILALLAVFASWVVRPAALAQGSMQGFPGSLQATVGSFPVSLIYEQHAGKEITYRLTARNDSSWTLTITGATVGAGSESDVFTRTRVDLPKHLVLAPGEEEPFVVHATFAKCRFAAAATTNPDRFALLPGMQVTFRQFGVLRTQRIDVRDGYAGIHTC